MKARGPKSWSRLDNAAKIFPPTSNARDTKVFRFACELREQVQEAPLQRALEETLALFPIFRSVIRHGLFWYYLEASDLEARVHPETALPCRSLFDKNLPQLLFDVSYFENRINFEVYHAITDGTGALQFMRTLVARYLAGVHGAQLGQLPALDYGASQDEKMADSFLQYYDRSRRQGKKKRVVAYRIRSLRIPEDRFALIKGNMPVRQILDLAHAYHTTVTGLLCALLILSIGQEMSLRDQKRRPVVITVPVNLRNYFASESARNFFGVINVGYDFGRREGSLEDIIGEVRRFFGKELNASSLARRMNSLGALEHNVFARVTPLVLKDLFMRWAYEISAMENTAALSNLGAIEMPEQFVPYIRLFDVFVSTDLLQICMCSYRDNMSICFTSAYVSTGVQRRFFRFLAEKGVDIELVTNRYQDQ